MPFDLAGYWNGLSPQQRGAHIGALAGAAGLGGLHYFSEDEKKRSLLRSALVGGLGGLGGYGIGHLAGGYFGGASPQASLNPRNYQEGGRNFMGPPDLGAANRRRNEAAGAAATALGLSAPLGPGSLPWMAPPLAGEAGAAAEAANRARAVQLSRAVQEARRSVPTPLLNAGGTSGGLAGLGTAGLLHAAGRMGPVDRLRYSLRGAQTPGESALASLASRPGNQATLAGLLRPGASGSFNVPGPAGNIPYSSRSLQRLISPNAPHNFLSGPLRAGLYSALPAAGAWLGSNINRAPQLDRLHRAEGALSAAQDLPGVAP